jgi:AcrR family transcriptional regulator
MDTRDIIVSAARRVFEKFGFSKTSMSDIAQAARKGRRTLYMHFTSKEDVFRAVIDTEVTALAKQLQDLISQPQPSDEKLRQYMHIRMNAIKDLTIYYDAMRQDLRNNLGLIENLRKQYDDMETEMIQCILDEGVTDGIFDIDDTALVARSIVLASKGFELPIYMGQSSYDHNSLIDPLIDLFYKGISRRS